MSLPLEISTHKYNDRNGHPYNITLIVHLYELEQTEWFIENINFFIKNNPENRYSIKCTIPIDTNIFQVQQKIINHQPLVLDQENSIKFIKEHAPYHPHLINQNNIKILYAICSYLYKNIAIPQQNMQIIFCENRGVDIGGFFLALDQIKQQKHEHDFLIKIHSKKDIGWRNSLMFFLKEKINSLLNQYECIYVEASTFPDPKNIGEEAITRCRILQKQLGLADMYQFNFVAGTMFIVSSKFTTFISEWDLISLFKKLNVRKNYIYEHIFERLFGCVFTKLNLSTYVHIPKKGFL